MQIETVRALFTLAGLQPLAFQPLIDGYGFQPSDTRYYETLPRQVWWFVKTEFGWVEIGRRKRVISINWRDTPFRGLITVDDVTKDDTDVHAWTDLKAAEYLTTLAERLKNP